MNYAFSRNASWVRLFGYIVHVKRGEPLFSERYGYRKYWPSTNYGYNTYRGWRICIEKEKVRAE